MNSREYISNTTIASLFLGISPSLLTAKQNKNIGIQAYTIREAIKENQKYAFKALSEGLGKQNISSHCYITIDNAEVGNGIIDYKSVFEAKSTAEFKYFIVEQDKCFQKKSKDCVKNSFTYLNTVDFTQ